MAKPKNQLSPETIQQIQDEVFEQAEVLVSANYFVLDVELVKEGAEWILRVTLDHPNEAVRVTVEDCKDISQALDTMLELNVLALTDFPYVLEVSSPGLFRTLNKPREFNFYAHRRIELQTEGQPPVFATLKGWNNDENCIALQLHNDETVTNYPWPQANTVITLSPDLTQEIELKTVPRRIERYD